jgi:hypothetical protein
MAPDPVVKGIWQHYKGGFYEVLGIAQDPAREGDFVVYEAIGITEDLKGEHDQRILRTGNKGALSICSPERFTQIVDGGEYTGGQKVPRFRLVSRQSPDR